MPGNNQSSRNIHMPDQGEIIHIDGMPPRLYVASKKLFNETGMVALCVAEQNASSDALHVSVSTYQGDEYVIQCETLRMIDVQARGYSSVGAVRVSDIMEVTDTIQCIFDY